ncbi:MAG: hypothetical protein N3A38_12875 [Planctomycetota bacterium]|nr:hypothetical protein [Planctomycetota bacterium]
MPSSGRKVRISAVLAGALAAAWVCCGEALKAQEPAKAPEPPKIVPPTKEEIEAELAKETPEQKALRAELAALAKAGQKIYFNANLGEGARNEVFVMGPDGSNVKQLTKEGGEYPHTPADGSVVYFSSGRIPLANPIPEALKDVPFDPNYPPFKTKEQKFQRNNKTPVIWRMNPDGSDPKPVAFGSMPHVSPDGKTLAYCIVSPPWPNQLVLMDLEKKVEKVISHPGMRNCGMPCFSPDGNYVVGANGAAYCAKLNAERSGIESVFMFDNGHPCNGEISPDGKFWAYVIDTDKCLGGWLCYRVMDYEKPGKGGGQLPLQHKRGSINYFPAFSPDSKYLVYAHAEQQEGVKSWEAKHSQELYVTRFPKCEATVRITWNGAANQHPHWTAK